MAEQIGQRIDPKNHVASVEKAVRLLELFSEKTPQLSLGELVSRGGYTRTTTYRLLSTLERAGWISRSGDLYQLTLRVFRLGATAVGALHLRREASAVMAELAATCGETVYLIVPDGPRGVCVERVEGPSLVRVMVLDVGKSLPLYVGGGPLALLAHRPDLVTAILAQQPLITPTGQTLSEDALAQTLADIREHGYSRSVEDVTSGVGAFGAPIFDAEGVAVAAISIGGLLPTLLAKEESLAAGLREAAKTISARLDYRV